MKWHVWRKYLQFFAWNHLFSNIQLHFPTALTSILFWIVLLTFLLRFYSASIACRQVSTGIFHQFSHLERDNRCLSKNSKHWSKKCTCSNRTSGVLWQTPNAYHFYKSTRILQMTLWPNRYLLEHPTTTFDTTET